MDYWLGDSQLFPSEVIGMGNRIFWRFQRPFWLGPHKILCLKLMSPVTKAPSALFVLEALITIENFLMKP